MAHDVFISYSTRDKPTADAVCAILESNGVRCWFAPRDIMPGADWGESLVKAIRESRVMLLVFSTNANTSKQIKREVEIATEGGVTVIPLRIENILPTGSFTYFLGNIHWMDALTPPLESHLQAIAEKVKAILSTNAPARSDAPGAPPTSTAEADLSSGQLDTRTSWHRLRRPAFIAAAVLTLVLAASVAFFWGTPPAVIDLNGTWTGNDKGTYVITQKDQKISWTGSNPPWFENVFDGLITDQDFIEGVWHDVPGYRYYGSGQLRLKIVSPDRLVAVSRTGNFGGTAWTRN